ncbi:hypothetical protein [Actinophytocola glycyrrhizae]|uniref:Uncharacterized protein n=1 Tax=Actinophytocola glycyrrhizae TaxID=2044873 RepID=A0ABV9S5T3_9PSEU
MLYIVLALVVAAFGLLIAALTTANTLWAWISVVVSVVAAALLVTDWLSGRRKARANESAKPTVVTVGGTRRDDRPTDVDDSDDVADDVVVNDDDDHIGPPAEPAPFDEGPPPPVVAAPPESDAEATSHLEPVVVRDPVDDSGEPDEEPTDASDLLVVAGLSVEVRVVDEHPRYHLATCTWLGPRATIPIAVSEARQLGFTPCARCGPDAILAARHRAAR